MSDIAIRVEGLGKQYRIGGKQEKYRTLRDTIADTFSAPFRRAGQLLRGQAYGAAGLNETIWALKDVSFEVKHGEVLGIIGRNGAGKSTLLKILSQITEPTEGYVDVYGRVGALLEVGTGFHPELTGRENIYLNGAILGMSRAEIDRKFDEIVDFAGVEKFIDTPVKYYSSGMGLRLGFAVAAHLEPEILVVDEVLAVGDAEFQKKCLGKMSDVAGQGRTVLFVSHNMAAIQHLCHRAALLQDGRLILTDNVNNVIQAYLSNNEKTTQRVIMENEAENQTAWFTKIEFCFDGNEDLETAISGQSLDIKLQFKSTVDINKLDFTIVVYDIQGVRLLHLSSAFTGQIMVHPPAHLNSTENIATCHIPRLPLPAGRYKIDVSIYYLRTRVNHLTDIASFDVIDGDYYGNGKALSTRKGKFLLDHQWILPSDELVKP